MTVRRVGRGGGARLHTARDVSGGVEGNGWEREGWLVSPTERKGNVEHGGGRRRKILEDIFHSVCKKFGSDIEFCKNPAK